MLRVGCMAVGALLVGCSAGASAVGGDAGHFADSAVDAGHPSYDLADASAVRDDDAVSIGTVLEIDAAERPDACTVAAAQGATYCKDGAQTIEYCEAEPEGGVCVELSAPPQWAYDLLLGCYAECVVTIRTSDHLLSGSCCYLAEGFDVGR